MVGRHCCIVDCLSRSHTRKSKLDKEVRFFRFPKVKTKQGKQVENLTKRRRLAWVSAVRRKNITFENVTPAMYVCALHFHSGEPAYEMFESHPDWAPTLNLGHNEIRSTDTSRFKRKQERVRKEAEEKITKKKNADEEQTEVEEIMDTEANETEANKTVIDEEERSHTDILEDDMGQTARQPSTDPAHPDYCPSIFSSSSQLKQSKQSLARFHRSLKRRQGEMDVTSVSTESIEESSTSEVRVTNASEHPSAEEKAAYALLELTHSSAKYCDKGQKAYLHHKDSPSWLPTLHLGYEPRQHATPSSAKDRYTSKKKRKRFFQEQPQNPVQEHIMSESATGLISKHCPVVVSLVNNKILQPPKKRKKILTSSSRSGQHTFAAEQTADSVAKISTGNTSAVSTLEAQFSSSDLLSSSNTSKSSMDTQEHNYCKWHTSEKCDVSDNDVQFKVVEEEILTEGVLKTVMRVVYQD